MQREEDKENSLTEKSEKGRATKRRKLGDLEEKNSPATSHTDPKPVRRALFSDENSNAGISELSVSKLKISFEDLCAYLFPERAWDYCLDLRKFDLSNIELTQWETFFQLLPAAENITSVTYDETLPKNIRDKIDECLRSRGGSFQRTVHFVEKKGLTPSPEVAGYSEATEAILMNDPVHLENVFAKLDKINLIRCLCHGKNAREYLLNIAIRNQDYKNSRENEKNIEIINFLLEKFRDLLNMASSDASTDIHRFLVDIQKVLFSAFPIFISHGNSIVLTKFLEIKIDIDFLKPLKPVIHAVRNGQSEIVELLLQNGFSADEIDEEGKTTALKEAVKLRKNALAISKVLIEHGAQVGKSILKSIVSPTNSKEKGSTENYWILKYFDSLDEKHWVPGEKRLFTFEELLAVAAKDEDALRDLQSCLKDDQEKSEQISQILKEIKNRGKRKEQIDSENSDNENSEESDWEEDSEKENSAERKITSNSADYRETEKRISAFFSKASGIWQTANPFPDKKSVNRRPNQEETPILGSVVVPAEILHPKRAATNKLTITADQFVNLILGSNDNNNLDLTQYDLSEISKEGWESIKEILQGLGLSSILDENIIPEQQTIEFVQESDVEKKDPGCSNT